MPKNCLNCKYRDVVPFTDCGTGFECGKACCDKNCPAFCVDIDAPGTCDKWEEKPPKGIPFYLQPDYKPRN